MVYLSLSQLRVRADCVFGIVRLTFMILRTQTRAVVVRLQLLSLSVVHMMTRVEVLRKTVDWFVAGSC